MLGWIELDTHLTTTVRRGNSRTGTWPDFVRALGAHVASESKVGRSVLPLHFTWGGFREHARQGLASSEYAAWNILGLDFDKDTQAAIDLAEDTLTEMGVAYLIHSSYSHGPEQAKYRIYIPVCRDLNAVQQAAAKRRLATKLGLTTDKMTVGGHTLFFTPRCPPGSEPYLSWVNGPFLDPDTLPADPAPERAKHALTGAVMREDWPSEVRLQAETELKRLASTIANDDRGSIRERFVKHVSRIGGYVGAGLLDEAATVAALEAAVAQRAQHNNFDDKCEDTRTSQVRDLLKWGIAKPVVPMGYDPVTGEAVPVAPPLPPGVPATVPMLPLEAYTGPARVRRQMAGQRPAQVYSLAGARKALKDAIQRPVEGKRRVVHISTGGGKTHAARKEAVRRAAMGQATVFLTADHALLGQINRDLQVDGVAVRHLASVTQDPDKTSNPPCQARSLPVVQAMVRAGVSVQGSYCQRCPFRQGCPALAHKRRKLTEYVVLAPYALAHQAVEMASAHGTPLVICDEEPPPPERVTVHKAAVEAMMADQTFWSLLRSDQKDCIRSMGYAITTDTFECVPAELILDAQKFHGQLHSMQLLPCDFMDHRQHIATAQRVLAVAHGWGTAKALGDRVVFDVPCSAWSVLEDLGGLVLSATPNPDMYPAGTEIVKLQVQDSNPNLRGFVYTETGNRKHVLAGGTINTRLLAEDLKAVKQRCDLFAPGGKTLIVTYKAVADALRTTHRDLVAGWNVDFVHYEIVRGRDDWRDHDCFVTLYDPRTAPRDGVEDLQAEWAAIHSMAARTLTQAHGRARDPQPRAKPCLHLHVGQIAPSDWYDAVFLNAKEDLGVLLRRSDLPKPEYQPVVVDVDHADAVGFVHVRNTGSNPVVGSVVPGLPRGVPRNGPLVVPSGSGPRAHFDRAPPIPRSLAVG